MAPDAVIRLVERAGEVGAAVGQRKAFALAPFVLGQAQHRDAVARDGLDRHEMLHVEPLRHLEQHAAAVLFPALGRQSGPGGVALRQVERGGVAGFVVEPARDMPGIAPLPRRDAIDGAAAQRVQLLREGRAVDRRRVCLLDALDRAALHEQPLDRIERRQRVVARLQRANLGSDAEQRAEEILDMRRQFDQQLRFRRMSEPVRIAPPRHQPVVQRNICFGEMRDKGAIDAHEAVAIVKIGEREPVREKEIGHELRVT